MEMQKNIFSCPLRSDDQMLLLNYIEEDNCERVQELLNTDTVNINHIYEDVEEFIYEGKTALQIACLYFEKTSEKCIQLLLDNSADFLCEDISNKNSIHFAVEGGNYNALQTILNHASKTNINISDSSVIFTLIKLVYDTDEKEETYFKFLQLLLTTNIDINYQDKCSGWTSIYMAAKYKFKQFIKEIIEQKKNEINLDEYKDSQGKSARDLITEQNLYSGELPEYMEENSNVTKHTLYKNLRNHKFDDFRDNYINIRNSLIDNDDFNDLLKLSIKLNLENFSKFLLDNKSNFEPILQMNDENLLVLAATKGYFKIVKLLLRKNPTSETVSEAIFKILKLPNITNQNETINYNNCLTLLLKSKNLKINSKDWNGNTALHYSLRYQDPKLSLDILANGASLASRDSFNNLAVSDMDSTTLESHLNECIRYENEDCPKTEHARIIIDLTTLLPPRESKTGSTAINIETKTSQDLNNPDKNEIIGEMEVLEYMSNSQDLKQHLTHPVILAFLYLKWHRIRMFFYINFTVYLLFILSLLMFITVGYYNKSQYGFLINLSYMILAITFIILIIREFCQMIIYGYRYFFTFENWLELVLLFVTAGILTIQTNETQTRQFSAIAIVAAAIELLLLIGQLHSMSTNIMMLRTVSFTFFKLLLWYSILLFAFAYSFFVLFQESDAESDANNSTTTGEEEQEFFDDPGMSLLKTIVMLTGEFDAASIKFDSYPIISQLIFVLFVFLIAIVLFNLLNGLAVSDTQVIKTNAELYGQILRVEHIAHIEKVLLTNKLMYYIPQVKKICLFPLNVKKMELLIDPNQNAKVDLIQTMINESDNERKPSCFKVYFGKHLEKKVQQDIRKLMKERCEASNKARIDDQKIEDIYKLLKELSRKVENLK